MKFVVSTLSKGPARLGTLSGISRLPAIEIQTPHVLLYTKGGAIPHITHEVLQLLSKDQHGLLIPLQNIAHIEDRMSDWDKTISEFVGMKEQFSYCTITDPGQPRLEGHHEKDLIAVWSRHGKKQFSAESYMSFINNLKPDMFLALCDGDTVKGSSKKRVEKSAYNTFKLLEKCLEIQQKSSGLKDTAMLGAVQGGYNEEMRVKCSEELASKDLFGIVVDGLHNGSKEVANIDIEEIKTLVEASLKHIPCDKLRIMHGCWNPKTVLGLVELGVDVFDTSYPFVVTERGRALVFPNDDSLLEKERVIPVAGAKQNGVSVELETEGSSGLDKWFGEPAAKRMKEEEDPPSPYEMSLHDPVHAESFIPISSTCHCLTCQQHTRAYIHHLLNVNELLGSVLLMLHNLHHYFEFFRTIRKAIQTERFEILKNNFTE